MRNACAAGYKGILQDGQLPERRSSSRSWRPGSASFVEDKLEHPIGQLGDRAGGLTAEAASWTGLPEGIAVAVGNVDAHVTAPAAQAVEPGPDGRHHGHLDLPRDELGPAARGPRHVRGGRRRHRRGQLGLRGRTERGRRHLRLVRGLLGAAGVRRRGRGQRRVGARAADPAGCGAGGGRARPRRPRLAQRQPLGPGGPPAVRAGARADARDEARGHLPRPARGDGLRHPGDHRDVPRRGCAGDGVRGGRGTGQERAADADLRRRHPAADLADRLGAGACTRRGDPRRGRRWRPCRRRARRPSGWARCVRPSSCRTSRGPLVYDALFAEYVELHDHFGRQGDAMRRLRGIRRRGRVPSS